MNKLWIVLRLFFVPLGCALVLPSCAAQKCKGMQISYERSIQYPTAARASRLEGEVALHLQITADGTIPEIDVLSGPSLLAESATICSDLEHYVAEQHSCRL